MTDLFEYDILQIHEYSRLFGGLSFLYYEKIPHQIPYRTLYVLSVSETESEIPFGQERNQFLGSRIVQVISKRGDI